MRILNVKDNAVTVGVLDKNVNAYPELREVTYVGDDGTPHTVFAHKDGPFQSAEEIVQAHRDGTLHTEAEHPDQPDEPAPPAGPVFE